MLRVSLVLISLLVILNGCSTYRNINQEQLSSLPQHYDQFDAKLAWEVRATDHSTVVDGVIKNIRYYEMDDIEVWVWALDANGKEMHRAVSFVLSLKENEAGPFTVELPKLASGTKLRFLYRYVAHEGGNESGGNSSWHQSFDSVVL